MVQFHPLDVRRTMEALAVPKPQIDAFYDIVEIKETLSHEEVVMAMKTAGLDMDTRVAVLNQLERPAPPPPPPPAIAAIHEVRGAA